MRKDIKAKNRPKPWNLPLGAASYFPRRVHLLILQGQIPAYFTEHGFLEHFLITLATVVTITIPAVSTMG